MKLTLASILFVAFMTTTKAAPVKGPQLDIKFQRDTMTLTLMCSTGDYYKSFDLLVLNILKASWRLVSKKVIPKFETFLNETVEERATVTSSADLISMPGPWLRIELTGVTTRDSGQYTCCIDYRTDDDVLWQADTKNFTVATVSTAGPTTPAIGPSADPTTPAIGPSADPTTPGPESERMAGISAGAISAIVIAVVLAVAITMGWIMYKRVKHAKGEDQHNAQTTENKQ
ncbi:uncharacterized protein LOC121386821 [Gigantopelta aegis]|uniref:uncharacterized protein LOC121386821 n=1 Tax=Gigantopelta aegis TaxID=1735272 RepID=UPI001B88A78B|nr:uncharacterized protein LOC121386821 [Gigantopelta aegis]